jgi:hypothetical protein
MQKIQFRAIIVQGLVQTPERSKIQYLFLGAKGPSKNVPGVQFLAKNLIYNNHNLCIKIFTQLNLRM